jgi:hypothetical protein
MLLLTNALMKRGSNGKGQIKQEEENAGAEQT